MKQRWPSLHMTKLAAMGTEHVHACEAIERYAAGIITLHEFCASVADIAEHLPEPEPGLLDPNTGLRYT